MFTSHGPSDEGAQARLLNAAYRLLGQGVETNDAAQRLAHEFALSRRQAYRYLEQAAALSAPVPVVEPTVAITFKLPVNTVRTLRAYARRSGLTLGQIVTQGLVAFFGAFHRRRG
jgi:predicted DNA-binding transcriptional regulator YafY